MLSRRGFLGAAAVTPMLRRGASSCVVADFGCILPESLDGFRKQAEGLPYDVLIVPGVQQLVDGHNEVIESFLARGSTVLVEYGAGKRLQPARYFPYVEYFWPVRVKIREFAPVSLHPAAADEIIATFGGKAVGLRRRVGNGTLITIGSPVGPVFRTGDPDARRWLEAVLLSAREARVVA
jgi:hypothetical protein